MMKEELIRQVMEEVQKNMSRKNLKSQEEDCKNKIYTAHNMSEYCKLTEFVGVGMGDTIGFVIANVDSLLHKMMNIDKRFRSIGIIGGRTGAGPQILAADEAVKATNTEIVSIEMARDTKGGAGHGSLIIFGAEDVSDARRAVEVTLKELDRTFGDIYGNEAGHVEFQYTARASYACNKAFNAPIGKSFGLTVGAPAAIGVLIADKALKSGSVDIVGYSSPAKGTSYTNESIAMITGDSGAVRQAIISAREVGIKALSMLGDEPVSSSTPYI